jgi:hypothetical protein
MSKVFKVKLSKPFILNIFVLKACSPPDMDVQLKDHFSFNPLSKHLNGIWAKKNRPLK